VVNGEVLRLYRARQRLLALPGCQHLPRVIPEADAHGGNPPSALRHRGHRRVVLFALTVVGGLSLAAKKAEKRQFELRGFYHSFLAYKSRNRR
jgi:hypothetical protein